MYAPSTMLHNFEIRPTPEAKDKGRRSTDWVWRTKHSEKWPISGRYTVLILKLLLTIPWVKLPRFHFFIKIEIVLAKIPHQPSEKEKKFIYIYVEIYI